VFLTAGSDLTSPSSGRARFLGGTIGPGNFASAGGGVYAEQSSFLNMTSTIVFGNNATTTGAGVFGNTVTMIIDGARFVNNFANSSGGGVQVVGDTTSVEIDNSEFYGNRAWVGNGGALEINGGVANVNNATMRNNVAGRDGGAIDCNSATVTISNSDVKIADNFCTASGCCESGCYSCPTTCTMLPAAIECSLRGAESCSCVPGSTTTPPLSTSTTTPNLNVTCPKGKKPNSQGVCKSGGGKGGLPAGIIALIVIICVCICVLVLVSIALCLIPNKKKKRKKPAGGAYPPGEGTAPVDETMAFGY